MTNIFKRRIGRKRREEIYKQIAECLYNNELLEDDPIWERAVEIGRNRHLPLTEAFKLAEQEFKNK